MMRLIIDKPRSGESNMAIDQALLHSASNLGVATLRIYQWQPATLSLGYFQKVGDRENHRASAACPLVRRASGGGAILHDREMTYSIAIPSQDRWASENRSLFDQVHSSLIACLKQLGVNDCVVVSDEIADQHSKALGGNQPFLCFERRSPGDVTIANYKVIGSAQRRLDNALLQHGSVLVEKSNAAPELPGIQELSPSCAVSIESIIDTWPTLLSQLMNWELVECQLTDEEQIESEKIMADRFANPAWNHKR